MKKKDFTNELNAVADTLNNLAVQQRLTKYEHIDLVIKYISLKLQYFNSFKKGDK